ncbi:MAG: hypothetical protein WDW36_006703 [Sanguina aurantia]
MRGPCTTTSSAAASPRWSRCCACPPGSHPRTPTHRPPLPGAAPASRGVSPANMHHKTSALRRLPSADQGGDGGILDAALAARAAAKPAQHAVAPTTIVLSQPLTPQQQEVKALMPAAVGTCWWEAAGFNPAKLLLKLVPPPPPEVDATGMEQKAAAKKGKGKGKEEVAVAEDMQALHMASILLQLHSLSHVSTALSRTGASLTARTLLAFMRCEGGAKAAAAVLESIPTIAAVRYTHDLCDHSAPPPPP